MLPVALAVYLTLATAPAMVAASLTLQNLAATIPAKIFQFATMVRVVMSTLLSIVTPAAHQVLSVFGRFVDANVRTVRRKLLCVRLASG